VKNYLLLVASLLCLSLQAQSPFVTQSLNSGPEGGTTLKSASYANKWIGAKLGGTIAGGGDLSDNILLSGRIVYNIEGKGFNLPIVSSVNFGDAKSGGFTFGDKGISVGIYPYKQIAKTASLTTVIHGGVAYKFQPGEAGIVPQQTRIFAGLEFAHFVSPESYPLTLSITPLYTINNMSLGNIFALETTAVVPISGGLGVLAELTNPFQKASTSIFKMGIIVNTGF
jgi:hypothetical protein